jgi:hypothetical protein
MYRSMLFFLQKSSAFVVSHLFFVKREVHSMGQDHSLNPLTL